MENQLDILILDDEISVCESLVIVLRPLRVHYETSLAGCLAYLEENPIPKLLIIDFKIGSDDGVSFYKNVISKTYGKVPAVLISGYVGQKEQPDNDDHFRSIFFKSIQKPFDIFSLRSEMMAIIKNLPTGT